MKPKWWLFFGIGALLGYQMKIIATKNITSNISAIDGGMMLGAVSFFLRHILTADHTMYAPHD